MDLCYSTNDPLHFNYGYLGSSYVTGSDTISVKPGDGVSALGQTITMGIGNVGITEQGAPIDPPPYHFYIQTPAFKKDPIAFLREEFVVGRKLDFDVSLVPLEKRTAEFYRTKYHINLWVLYPDPPHYSRRSMHLTSSREQDPETAYLKVLEFEEREDGSFDLALAFRCKLYGGIHDKDSRLFGEVTNGIIRLNLK
ncbi:hypothetical protein GCM10027275_12440 [Rhabdobacter roseus]|uniref:Uncharacterized protein n=1 Tax=Rhabdobacter roseus TaxID=1655419 RepID=A0A840TT26_9BACT|nr:hypothetical protein [Rhabdobacter roseus]MBB5283160.1 hypothetical protein [Rhabdobacter roseus]